MSEKNVAEQNKKLPFSESFLRKISRSAKSSEKHNVHISDIYNWKRKLFENGASVFEGKSTVANSAQQKNIEALEANY